MGEEEEKEEGKRRERKGKEKKRKERKRKRERRRRWPEFGGLLAGVVVARGAGGGGRSAGWLGWGVSHSMKKKKKK